MTSDEIRELIINRIQKDNGEKKKVLLSNLSTATLLSEGDSLLKKLERNVSVYKENGEDILVVFSVQPGIEDKLRIFKEELVTEFEKILETYSSADWCVMVDYDDMDEIYDLCDAYYGDWSIGAWRCRYMKKPVMIQNAEV